MFEGSHRQRLAELTPALIATAAILGMIPPTLGLSEISSFYIGTTFFVLNLALCALGFASAKFRLGWLLWAALSIACFILFGMATPVGMILILPLFL